MLRKKLRIILRIETDVYPENETIEEPTLEPEDNIVQPHEPSSLIWGAYHDNKFYKVVRDNLTFSEAQLNANQSSFLRHRAEI